MLAVTFLYKYNLQLFCAGNFANTDANTDANRPTSGAVMTFALCTPFPFAVRPLFFFQLFVTRNLVSVSVFVNQGNTPACRGAGFLTNRRVSGNGQQVDERRS